MTEDLYYSKYLKYKNKYTHLKALIGGATFNYKDFMEKIKIEMATLEEQYKTFETGYTKGFTPGYRIMSLRTDNIDRYYECLNDVKKSLSYWMETHPGAPISELEKQSSLTFEIIKNVYIQICKFVSNEIDYNIKYDNGKSYKHIRELAIEIYTNIHPELVEAAIKEDEEFAKTRLRPVKPVYRIGNGIGCDKFPVKPKGKGFFSR
jgi:hypothetical protein